MDTDFKNALIRCETDVGEVLERLSGDEELYYRCLNLYLEDNTIPDLDRAISLKAWDDAFTAAHALKGLAGNMGFIPLYHAAAEMVILIRSGRIDEAAASYREIKRCHDEVTAVIHQYCDTPDADCEVDERE